MLVLTISMLKAGNLVANIFNELEKSQVLESNVLMARQQCRNKGLEVFSKIRKEKNL